MVMLYFDPIELKFRTQIVLGTKQEYAKFGVDWSNGSLVIVIRQKCCNPFFSVSGITVVVSS